jgi:sodium/hydrogen exchanger 3
MEDNESEQSYSTESDSDDPVEFYYSRSTIGLSLFPMNNESVKGVVMNNMMTSALQDNMENISLVRVEYTSLPSPLRGDEIPVIGDNAELGVSRSYSHSPNAMKKAVNSPAPLNTRVNKTMKVKEHEGISLWGWRWHEVNSFLVVSLFLLTAALVKLAYHHTCLHNHLPESCVLIILGTLFELVSFLSHLEQYVPRFSSKVFFFLLLPPIILESAYSLHDRVFFTNIGTILLYAIVGTLINIFLIGPSLYLVSFFGLLGLDISVPLIECLVFSTLISAVDPVAVLAIFQEIGVNKALYFLVFGESLLNDAVVITVYNVMTVFAGKTDITAANVFLGCANFMTVSGGGLFIGLVHGVVTALITRFTENVRVVEPMIVIVIAYMSYVTAELFHFSGIIGIIGCGLMQIEYAKYNISSRSFVTIKYFTKNLSTISDVIIFFFLGKVLVRETHVWSTTFALAATLFCIIYRFLSVFSLTWIANKVFHRIHSINFEEQLVMAYGGLRGAIAFSLAISLDEDEVTHSKLFVSSTLFVILFTVFVLGSTTKTMVKLLRVKTEEKQDPKMLLFLTDKVVESCMIGIEDVTGNQTYFHWINKLSQWNEKYFKRLLVRGWVPASTEFTSTYNKIKQSRPKSFISLMVNRGSVVSNISLRRDKQNHVEASRRPSIPVTPPPPTNVSNANNSNSVVKFSPSVSRLDLNGSDGTIHSNSATRSTREEDLRSSPKRSTSRKSRSSSKNPNQIPRWNLIRNVVSFTSRMTRNSRSDSNHDPGVVSPASQSRSQSRKHSLITLMREDSEDREHNEVKRQLNSALTRTSFYHLPGSIFIEDTLEEDPGVRQRGTWRKATATGNTSIPKTGLSNSLESSNPSNHSFLNDQPSHQSSWNTRRRSSVQDESLMSSRTETAVPSVNRSTRMTTGTTIGSRTTAASSNVNLNKSTGRRNLTNDNDCC